jgi:pimeloyl-ACP methyl ester carboxylesterase
MERKLAERPKINVPLITLYGGDDGIARPAAESPAEKMQLPALIARRVIDGAGHFLPREKPDAVSSALLEVLAASR